ncbi:Phytochrome-like protein cph2 [Marinomonas spartinae]|uniref:sensor domain-containing diguanylate cyclase n=1 Tax=Marinomonas spartinae TaxID=1792290 RepID=UPI000808CD26|nr:sensor domain-containing diguanylate cyclase [Marinomonas spartinae]SBS32965.1 Phytochrome-like protein cph2 [Marinomonas spartinae]
MANEANTKLKPLKQLGFRLNLVLLSVLSFYILTTGYSLLTLREQSQEFDALSSAYFDRAMHAAELSREAEVIASDTLVNMLNQDYDERYIQSPTIGLPEQNKNNASNDSFERSFEKIRKQLTANTPQEQVLIEKIDRLKKPYFNTIRTLNNYLIEKRKITQAQRNIEYHLLNLQKEIYLIPQIPEHEKSLIDELIKAINLSVLTLHSTTFHQLITQMNGISAFISNIAYQDNLTPFERKNIILISKLSQQVFTTTLKQQMQHSATLTAVNTTRTEAKKLSNACYKLYQLLKQSTQKASSEHKAFISKVMLKIGLFSIIFLLLTGVAYWFIHYYLIRRLNRLNRVMLEHVKGVKTDVPQSGNDEIAMMGRAFSIFVEATNKAQQDSLEAQKRTEEANQKLTQLNQSLKKLSHTDELTQMANRRHFFHELTSMWQLACDKQINMSIIMLDLDWFKSFNDFYGHQAGDQCLFQVAQLILTEVKNTQGIAARYGGEEFIILLPYFDLDQAVLFAKGLQDKLNEEKIKHHKSPQKYITLSQGVTSHIPKEGDKFDHLIHLADQALYKAKNNGRNQIVAQDNTENVSLRTSLS